MSLGSWDPDSAASADTLQLDRELLDRLAGYGSDPQLQQVEQLLTPGEQQVLAGLMKIDHGRWQHAAQPLADDTLLGLIRFFAMAENLPGWEAGANSPVIPLARALRKRGVRLDKDLLQWLRQVNDNRFLPYGPL